MVGAMQEGQHRQEGAEPRVSEGPTSRRLVVKLGFKLFKLVC